MAGEVGMVWEEWGGNIFQSIVYERNDFQKQIQLKESDDNRVLVSNY